MILYKFLISRYRSSQNIYYMKRLS